MPPAADPGLVRQNSTTTSRIIGIITIPAKRVAGTRIRSNRPNGTNNSASGITPLKITSSVQALAFNGLV
jgi:hypothetical protein